MTNRGMTGECDSCESVYSVGFTTEIVSNDVPEYCPFCGEKIESITEGRFEEDEEDDIPLDEEWE